MGKCTNDFNDSKVHIRCSFCMEAFMSSIAQDVCIMRLQAICHVVDLAVPPPPQNTPTPSTLCIMIANYT